MRFSYALLLLFLLYAAASTLDCAIQEAEEQTQVVVPCDTDSDCLEKNPHLPPY